MAKADVLQLVDDLSLGEADQTMAAYYYEDVIRSLGLQACEVMMDAVYVQLREGVGVYALPDTLITPVAVFADALELFAITQREAEHADRLYTRKVGTPRVYVTEGQPQRSLRLIPIPDFDGPLLTTQTPLTEWVPNNLTLIGTVIREDFHPWEELWITLEVLVREFSRDSDHQDLDFASQVNTLAAWFRGVAVEGMTGRA